MALESLKVLCLCAAAVLPAASGGCCMTFDSKARVTEERDLTLPMETIETLRIETRNGKIALSGSAGARDAAVHAVVEARGEDEADAARCLEAIRLVTRVEGKTQLLSWEWEGERERTWQASVSFEVSLPARLAVKAESSNGEIVLSGMKSGAVLRTHNGGVEVRGHEGDLEVKTHNGGVDVEAAAPALSLLTHNGRVAAKGEFSRVSIETYNGSIRGVFSGKGPIEGKIGTYNGSIRLSLGDGLAATVAATTDNGRIRVDRDMTFTVRKKAVVVGTIGSGGGKLDIETRNGSVVLEAP